jgi:3-phosphoshikimate 1-carboxyvinyltransferase
MSDNEKAIITDPWPAPVAKHPVGATVRIPGSKSLSNRYLVLAALGDSPVTVHGLLRSRDTDLMIQALQCLGVTFEEPDANDGTTIRILPPPRGVFRGDVDIYCGLAGTVMRFVPGLALFADGPVHFDGDAQAYARPMRPVLDGLEQLGAHIHYDGEPGFLPFTITPAKSMSITPRNAPTNASSKYQGPVEGACSPMDERRRVVTIDSSASSQFISGLILIASRLPYGCEIRHVGDKLPSMPHIRMTMEDVRMAGGCVVMHEPAQWVVRHADLSLPQSVVVEPDLSNAAPFLGAAMLTGGTVRIPLWPKTTTQPGGLVPQILCAMGADVTWNDVPWHEVRGSLGQETITHETTSHKTASNDTVSHDIPSPSQGTNVEEQGIIAANGTLEVTSIGNIHGLGVFDCSAAGEIAPSIAALCVFADAPSSLVGIGHLRGHETNRLQALVTEIRRIGGEAEELSDGIRITPVPREQLRGTTMETYADHRMATFAAMIGLIIGGTCVRNVATTRKTIPDFTGMWTSMIEQTSAND